MNVDFLDIFQHRMDRAAAEQIWAIAILGSLSVFIFNYAIQLRRALEEVKVIWGIRIFTALVCLFLWSRHGIYFFYSHQHDLLADLASPPYLSNLTWIESAARFWVMWSGIFLYTVIAVGMAYASIRAFKKAEVNGEAQHQGSAADHAKRGD